MLGNWLITPWSSWASHGLNTNRLEDYPKSLRGCYQHTWEYNFMRNRPLLYAILTHKLCCLAGNHRDFLLQTYFMPFIRNLFSPSNLPRWTLDQVWFHFSWKECYILHYYIGNTMQNKHSSVHFSVSHLRKCSESVNLIKTNKQANKQKQLLSTNIPCRNLVLSVTQGFL